MGMFDYVRCEVPLPDGYAGELQTKDFDSPYLLTHVITKEGRLLQGVLLRIEEVPKAERDYPDAPDDDIRSWIGSQRHVTEQRDANFHGMLSFYGLGDHEYVAKFTDGQLVGITLDRTEGEQR
jgi:hypothetical protein